MKDRLVRALLERLCGELAALGVDVVLVTVLTPGELYQVEVVHADTEER